MDGVEILGSIREQLADEAASVRAKFDPPNPLDISPWVAMSLLQKAIRRSEAALALRAAASLLRSDPMRFWRRICGIAFEDIGLADLEAVYLSTSAMSGKRTRAVMGGEWAVASFLTARLAQSSKCRAADDLLMTIDQHPAFEVQRRNLAFEDVARLCRVASSTAAIETRSIAAWYAMGVQPWLNSNLHSRVGSPTAFFDRLCEDGHPQTLVEVAREGHRRGAGMLAPLLVLLHRSPHDAKMHEGDDALPPERICGEWPAAGFSDTRLS